MCMGAAWPQDHIAAFTEELLRTGFVLSDLAVDLVEAIPRDAYPGEEPAAVILEMVTGTIRAALVGAPERDVRRATELIGEAQARVLEHLELALELSRHIRGEAGRRPRRTHG